jgi:hypothetical protein
MGDGNCAPGTKRNVAESATIFDQREFCFGAAMPIVEHRLGETVLRQPAGILDVDAFWRTQVSVRCHLWWVSRSQREDPPT